MYRRLTEADRIEIYSSLKAEKSLTEIADVLGCHRSTVSREIRRNCGGRGYRFGQAHRMAMTRVQEKSCARISADTWTEVETLLREDWSPEQICGRLRHRGECSVSPEWIYQYVYSDKRAGGDLSKHLRSQKKRRKRYRSGQSKRGQIPDMRPIEERPSGAVNRSQEGHLEGDLVVGRQGTGAIVTLVDRKTRYTKLAKVERKTAVKTVHAVKRALSKIIGIVKTITFDRGREFAGHKKIEEQNGVKVYFANPYCSWERGTNENTNGLIRQYLPKGMSFKNLTEDRLRVIENKLNNRPRKILGFKTPNEVMNI